MFGFVKQRWLLASVFLALGIVLVGVAGFVAITKQPLSVLRPPPSSAAIPRESPPIPPTRKTNGWKTYQSATREFSFQYPPQFPLPQEDQQASGQYAITVGDLELQYVSPERNRVAGYTLQQFTRMPWLHKADDPYTEITVGGMRAALYDLVLPSYPRGEEEPIRGYARTLQVGLETPGGGFLELSADSALFPDAASARTADLSWFPALLSTVVFDK